jgi:uncharacterized protein YegP (UPF0339 family)
VAAQFVVCADCGGTCRWKLGAGNERTISGSGRCAEVKAREAAENVKSRAA